MAKTTTWPEIRDDTDFQALNALDKRLVQTRYFENVIEKDSDFQALDEPDQIAVTQRFFSEQQTSPGVQIEPKTQSEGLRPPTKTPEEFTFDFTQEIEFNIVEDPNLATTGSGAVEFLGPDEPQNPTPGIPTIAILDKKRFEASFGEGGRESAILGEKLHFLPEVDVEFAKMRRDFEKTLTPEQLAVDERVYQEVVDAGRENRSFEQWFEVSRLDAYLRGFIAPDKADEWRRQKVYTPEQVELLEKAKARARNVLEGEEQFSFSDNSIQPFDPAEAPIQGEVFKAGAVERAAVQIARDVGLTKLLPIREAGLAGGAAVPSPDELAQMTFRKKLPEIVGTTANIIIQFGAAHGLFKAIGFLQALPKSAGILTKAAETAKLFAGVEAIEQVVKGGFNQITDEDVPYEGAIGVLKSGGWGMLFSLAAQGTGKAGRALWAKLKPTEQKWALKQLGLKKGADIEEINQAARELSKKFHQDKVKGFSEDFNQMIKARDILRGPGGIKGTPKGPVEDIVKARVKPKLIPGEVKPTTAIAPQPTVPTKPAIKPAEVTIPKTKVVLEAKKGGEKAEIERKPLPAKEVKAGKGQEGIEPTEFTTKSGRLIENVTSLPDFEDLTLSELQKMNPETLVSAKFVQGRGRGGASRQKIKVKNIILAQPPTAEGEGAIIVPEQIQEGKGFKPVTKKGPGLTQAEQEKLTVKQQQELRFKQTQGEEVGFKVGREKTRIEARAKIKSFQLAEKLTDKNRTDALDVVRQFVPKEKQSVFTKRILAAKTPKRVDRISQAVELFIAKAEKKEAVREFKGTLKKLNKEFGRGEAKLGKLPNDIRDRVLEVLDKFDPAKLSEKKRKVLEKRDQFIKRVSGTVANAFESLEDSAVDILQIPNARIRELERLSKTHIGELSTEQINYVRASLEHMIEIVQKRAGSKERARAERISKQVNTARQEVSKRVKQTGIIEQPKGVGGLFKNVFVQGQSSIRTMTGRATNKDNKATMDLLVEKIQDAKRDEHAIFKEFTEASDKAITQGLKFTEKDSQQFDKLVKIKLGGKKFKIDIDNLFSIYMHIKAEGNLRQLLKTRGLNITVIERNPKLLNTVKSKKQILTGRPELSELREVIKIIEAIPKFKELSEATFKLNKDVVSPKINETSIAFQNFPIARKDRYWPQPRVLPTNVEGKPTDISVAIEQQGMFLPKKGGTERVLIKPYRSQYVNILQTSAQFSANTLPIRDARSLLGDRKWQDKMRKAGRGAELKGIITMFRRMQGLSTDQAFVDLAGAKLLNNFGKSVLSLRLSGYGVQVASIPASYEFIDPKYFKTTEAIRKIARIPDKDIEEMENLSPTLWVRWKAKQFNFVTGGVAAQHSFNNMVLGKSPLLDKFLNQYTWGDQKAIKIIFDAAQNKVAAEQNLKKGTKANKKAAIKETERALETQPNWDIIYRSPLTSSPNVFLRGSLLFQSARNAQMNVLMRAIDDFNKGRIGAGEAGKRMGGVLYANILVAIVKRLIKFGVKASIFGLIFAIGDEKNKEAAVGAIATEGLKDISRLPLDITLNIIGLPAFGNIPANIARETIRSFKRPGSAFRKLSQVRTGNFFADLTLDATVIGIDSGALVKHLLTQEEITRGPRKGRLKWKDDAKNIASGVAELITIRYGIPLAAPKQELFFQAKTALKAIEKQEREIGTFKFGK